MRKYQKLTLITAILGLVIPIIGLFFYFFINSLIGIPILGLILRSALLIALIIIAINIGAIVSVFKIKDTKIVAVILFVCGALLFLTIHVFAIPGLILFVISGITALRYKDNGLINGSARFKKWYWSSIFIFILSLK